MIDPSNSSESIGISAEDQFSVIDTFCPTGLFPHQFTIANLAMAMEWTQGWRFLWDFRKSADHLYGDVADAYEEAALWSQATANTLLVTPDNREALQEFASRTGSSLITIGEKQLPIHNLNLEAFNEDIEFLVDYGQFISAFPVANPSVFRDLGFIRNQRTYTEYSEGLTLELEERFGPLFETEELSKQRATILHEFLRNIATNSLLSEIALVGAGDTISVIPFHSYSTHNVIAPGGSETVLVQPSRLSIPYWRRFAGDIAALERAVNQPRIQEREIEEILRRNPLFLRGLNYTDVFHQVILPRHGAPDFRPDIIARPVGSEWYDVIELKLPSSKVLTGRENRRSLSASITEAVAQLREYSAYFDDRRLARIVQQKYGIKCHKPRLVVVVGRDHRQMTEDQSRRALTAYPNLSVVTYDQLLDAARRFLLL